MAILCIGDELLDGRVADANGRYLMEQSGIRHWSIGEMRIVADDEELIAEALADLSGVDLVVVSGGLGPTSDDVTRQGAARFAGDKVVEDTDEVARLRARFEERRRPFTENNRRQCAFPESAEILATEVGTAAGFRMRVDERQYYFFPGVRREFRWYADRYLPSGGEADGRVQRRFAFFGLGESDLATRLSEAEEKAGQLNVRVGFRASFPIVEVSLKGSGEDCQAISEMILHRLGPWLVAEDGESLAERLGKRLIEAGATVSVVESCTAGLLGATLTEVSGSSSYFEEGYLTYSNEAKERLVDVNSETLTDHGAVSPQVALEMARGARERSGADFALSITGIAGPTGGTAEKPVGTVHFGLASPEGVYLNQDLFVGRSRRAVRTLSVYRAMALLLWRLEGKLNKYGLTGPFQKMPGEGDL